MIKKAALILAGGKAERFQLEKGSWHDKALAKLSDKPLLVHAIENVSGVVEEIIVCVNDEDRKRQYSKVLIENGLGNVKLVIDEKIDGLGGPIVAILTGLKSTNADYCLTIPADMPMLKPQVAEYLLNQAKDSNVVVPMWPNGRLETLIMVLKRPEILNVSTTLCQLNRSRPLDIIRAALKLLFASPIGEIRSLDPELKSFVNINFPQDLAQLQARQTQGPVTENLRLNLGDLPMDSLHRLQEASAVTKKETLESAKTFSACAQRFESEKLFFWSALSREIEGKILIKQSNQKIEQTIDLIGKGKAALLQAAKNYASEAQIYEENNCFLVAEGARADQSWCESVASRLK